MNRMEEYEAMMARMETVPASDPVGKARARLRRRRWALRPLAAAAAAFGIFVGLLNLSPTVSAACRTLPLLRELVELLTFNPSLRIAIEHDYVQMVGMEQTKDGVKARVEYLIVDQKQVNIFYTLSSQTGGALDATPELFYEDGTHVSACVSSGGIYEDGELRQITVDFVDEDVPDFVNLTLKVRDVGDPWREAPASQEWDEPEEPEYDTQFTFDLRFDPKYTEQGRIVELNRSVELDGQKITVTDMEIYPTHIRINVEEAQENTAWLESLRFYLELEDGSHVETISNGISATGSPTTPSMTSYRAESSFFSEAKCIRLCITGADFLDKAQERLHVNLRTMEHDPLPEGYVLHGAEQSEHGWTVSFWVKQTQQNHVQLLSSTYFNGSGGEFFIERSAFSTVAYDEAAQAEVPGWSEERYYLEDFDGDEVWLQLNFTRFWNPEKPVVAELTGEGA